MAPHEYGAATAEKRQRAKSKGSRGAAVCNLIVDGDSVLCCLEAGKILDKNLFRRWKKRARNLTCWTTRQSKARGEWTQPRGKWRSTECTEGEEMQIKKSTGGKIRRANIWNSTEMCCKQDLVEYKICFTLNTKNKNFSVVLCRLSIIRKMNSSKQKHFWFIIVFLFLMFHVRVESRHSSSTRFVLGRRCSTGTWVSVTFSVALLMTFQVQGQVIRTWKTAIAMNTFERLGTSVFAIMASQFVTSGESPLTSFPRTLVRLLTCKKTKKKFHSFHPKEYNGKGYVIWSFSFLKISSSSRNQQRGKVSGRTCATTSLFAAKKELAACQNWPAWRLRTTGNSMSHPPRVHAAGGNWTGRLYRPPKNGQWTHRFFVFFWPTTSACTTVKINKYRHHQLAFESMAGRVQKLLGSPSHLQFKWITDDDTCRLVRNSLWLTN